MILQSWNIIFVVFKDLDNCWKLSQISFFENFFLFSIVQESSLLANLRGNKEFMRTEFRENWRVHWWSHKIHQIHLNYGLEKNASCEFVRTEIREKRGFPVSGFQFLILLRGFPLNGMLFPKNHSIISLEQLKDTYSWWISSGFHLICCFKRGIHPCYKSQK